MPTITEEGRLRRGRGTGEGKDYKPWIENREVNSMGTASEVIDSNFALEKMPVHLENSIKTGNKIA